MVQTPSPPSHETPHGPEHGGRLHHIVSHLAHYLPAQGPIGVFIHHNTLHAFQHLPFEKAVLKAAEMYGTEPYMTERAYRDAFAVGRIREEDIDDVMLREPEGPSGIPGLSRRALRKAMLMPGLRSIDRGNAQWLFEEGELEPLDLFLVCRGRIEGNAGERQAPSAVRPRDGILARYGIDLDDVIHPLLIKLLGAFFDQGLAYWALPGREHGFLAASRAQLSLGGVILPPYLSGAVECFRELNPGAETAVRQSLERLGIAEDEWEHALKAELLALPGWAGMMWRLEEEPHLAPHDHLRCSLLEFLAVRLALTAVAAASIAGSARRWRAENAAESGRDDDSLALAAQLLEAARVSGVTAAKLRELNAAAFRTFQQEVQAFGSLERRRVFHLAYERRHERQILGPLLEHRQSLQSLPEPKRLAAQVFFCIDEREESIRRHLEELDPDMETFGAAGFFGVAMNYTGIDDPHGAALCPVVVTPRHAIVERPHEDDHAVSEQRKTRRKLWASVAWNGFISTRTMMRGWLSTAILGVFTIFPLATRVLAPRRYAQLAGWLNERFLPEPRTELQFMRGTEAGHHAAEGLLQGFAVNEKVECVASVLGPAGLRKSFARLVVVLGHGSTSLNNPHESAHDCGACGGRRGGPNARLFAMMANRPEVRAGLKQKGIHIPEDTWFVGGYHDTCNDDVELFDLASVPDTHSGDLARVRASLERARQWSAHERSRRFEAADDRLGALEALHHVEERAEHLAEPRPEYGHCTNSVCIVGRRAVTRGLFFDRRAFLVSYDATVDPENEGLARVLGAVIPVCAGISLEYYFSFVDNEGYGCGTKLPHNITGLVGVMNGYESDLRTGLPWQMVEIHEPVRILFVVETTPRRLLDTIRKNPLLTEFLENRWIRLAALDPIDGRIQVYRDGVFQAAEGGDRLETAPTSARWYQGRYEHLAVAKIAGSVH